MYGYFLHGKTKPTQQSLSIREHFPRYDKTGFGSLIEKSILGTSPRRISPKVANWKLINLLVIRLDIIGLRSCSHKHTKLDNIYTVSCEQLAAYV